MRGFNENRYIDSYNLGDVVQQFLTEFFVPHNICLRIEDFNYLFYSKKHFKFKIVKISKYCSGFVDIIQTLD